MSKRPRAEAKPAAAPAAPILIAAPEAGPNAYYPNAADDGLASLAYGPNIGLLLSAQSGSSDAIAELSALAKADVDVLHAEQQHRGTMIEQQYRLAAQAQYRSAAVASELMQQAARSVAAEFIVCMARGTSADAASDRASERLQEYGLVANADMRAKIRAAIIAHAQEADAEAMDDSSLAEPVLRLPEAGEGVSRPLRGATSGAAYLNGERESGYPPYYRETWRYPVEGSDGGTVLDPALLAEARKILRRPAFPDRLHPFGPALVGAGSAHARAVALAAQWDEAAATEGRLAKLQQDAFKSVEHLSSLL